MTTAELPAEVRESLQNCIHLYNSHHDREEWVTADDYVVFLRDNGYAVILRRAYDKLGQKKKKLLAKGCYYISL